MEWFILAVLAFVLEVALIIGFFMAVSRLGTLVDLQRDALDHLQHLRDLGVEGLIAVPSKAERHTQDQRVPNYYEPEERGYHPDPLTEGRYERWWDGNEWLDETKPPGGPAWRPQ